MACIDYNHEYHYEWQGSSSEKTQYVCDYRNSQWHKLHNHVPNVDRRSDTGMTHWLEDDTAYE